MANDTTDSADATESTSASARTLSRDSVFDLLSERRRRFVLQCLQKYDNPMALADMADEIAVWENGTEITDISAEEVKLVYTSLYHTHIPKLVEAGVVEYNQEQDTVSLSGNATQLRSRLDLFEE